MSRSFEDRGGRSPLIIKDLDLYPQPPLNTRSPTLNSEEPENETCAPERCPPYGSSPLTRGKHIMRRGWPTCPGITPRWAGCHPHAYRATIPRRTHPRSRREHTSNAIGIVRSPDHPCSRGEHTPHVRKARPCSGSSLLTRGTHRLICANITQLRQIMEAQLNAYP